MSEEVTYTARWLFPVDGPPVERGSITIRADKITAVEAPGARSADVDLGDVAILPGFVNAHTHLDLTGTAGRCTPVADAPGSPDFTQWLRQVIKFRFGLTAGEVRGDIMDGIAQCLRFGATAIGDISAAGVSWDFLVSANCRSVVFHEFLGLTEDRVSNSWNLARTWLERRPPSDRCTPGVSPHAPYSVHSTQYSVTVLGAQSALVVTHLAESLAEIDLLKNHSGPFRDFLQELNFWNPSGLISSPADVIKGLPRGIFVHCNYLDPATPFLPTQTVVVCPRTHAAFGHPHHPFPQMKVRVALGTDSLASNPDLDILAEARFLRVHYPEVEPVTILRMLTLNGAEALGFDTVAGSLTPGKSADLVVLPLANEEPRDPHDLVLQSSLPVQRVMFRGEWTV